MHRNAQNPTKPHKNRTNCSRNEAQQLAAPRRQQQASRRRSLPISSWNNFFVEQKFRFSRARFPNRFPNRSPHVPHEDTHPAAEFMYPPIISSYHYGIFCKFEQISQLCSSAMVGAMMQQQQRGACVAGVGVGGVLDVVASSRVRMQTVGKVKSDKRSEPFDQLKLKLARREASILRSQETMNYDRLCVVSAVASQALQDKAALLFARICVNPKVLSPEAAEFMLTVSASHTTLSQSESESASQADLILRGVHPTSFQPVLLVCTTTMFTTPIAQSDVEKAKRRGELWRRAVGAAFLVVPLVAGFAVSTEVVDFSKDMGVVCCDISM